MSSLAFTGCATSRALALAPGLDWDAAKSSCRALPEGLILGGAKSRGHLERSSPAKLACP